MTTSSIMLSQVIRLIDTSHLSEWENLFLTNLAAQTKEGTDISALKERQIEAIRKIYTRNF